MHSLLHSFLILTAAALVFVPLFRFLHLGAILAYLFAGIVIGPSLLGLVADTETILHFSELGVVFLLFLIGLELAPSQIWKLRHSIFGFGLLQVVLTGALLAFVAYLFGFSVSAAYVIGFGFALSSTAFAIQLLKENKQMATVHGQGAFSVLMFQDLAVVPILASLTLFSSQEQPSLSVLAFVKMLLILGLLVLIGRYVIRHVFRLIADTRAQEIFTAMSLFIVIGTAIWVESIGLSMGMGAFLAGVLLANGEYRHEIETSLQPFKGLLLGLFFMAVGMTLKLSVLFANVHWVVLITLAFVAAKMIILYALARLFRFAHEPSRNIAVTIPQGGEFAFVLFGAAIAQGILNPEVGSILNAAITLSMVLSPFLFAANKYFLRTYSELSEKPVYDTNFDSTQARVVIAGFGRFGQIVSRILKSENIPYTILEHSAAQVEIARKFGAKVYYADASRADIVESAGGHDAKIFVLAIADHAKSIETAQMVQKHFPHLHIIARARNRQHAMDLLELGITNVHRETYLTSLEVAKEVLLAEGRKRENINIKLALFRKHDEQILRDQLAIRHDEKQFISFTNQANAQLEQTLAADAEGQIER